MPDQLPPSPKHVQIATQFAILNDQRMVVLTGRDHLALNDTQIAVPFGLLKHLAGSLQMAEGQAELVRRGAKLTDNSTPRTS